MSKKDDVIETSGVVVEAFCGLALKVRAFERRGCKRVLFADGVFEKFFAPFNGR